MSNTPAWLTTAELVKHGVSAAKARYHAKTLKDMGLAKKTHQSRAGHWIFAPEAVVYLQKDRRKDKGCKPIPAFMSPLIRVAWHTHKSVTGVAEEFSVSWYTAARWLDELGLRPMAEGTMINYENRGKSNG